MNLDSDVEKVKQRGECVVVGMEEFGAVIRWLEKISLRR